MIEYFSFSEALAMIKDDMRLARKSWNGKDMYVELYRPVIGEKISKPFIMIKNAKDEFIPWIPNQNDLLQNDWFLV